MTVQNTRTDASHKATKHGEIGLKLELTKHVDGSRSKQRSGICLKRCGIHLGACQELETLKAGGLSMVQCLLQAWELREFRSVSVCIHRCRCMCIYLHICIYIYMCYFIFVYVYVYVGTMHILRWTAFCIAAVAVIAPQADANFKDHPFVAFVEKQTPWLRDLYASEAASIGGCHEFCGF